MTGDGTTARSPRPAHTCTQAGAILWIGLGWGSENSSLPALHPCPAPAEAGGDS